VPPDSVLWRGYHSRCGGVIGLGVTLPLINIADFLLCRAWPCNLGAPRAGPRGTTAKT